MSNEVLVLFRHIFKLAIKYPSRNRVLLLSGIHEAFHNARGLTSKAEIDERLNMAKMGLAHLQFYDQKMKEISQSKRPVGLGTEESTNFPKGDKFVYF